MKKQVEGVNKDGTFNLISQKYVKETLELRVLQIVLQRNSGESEDTSCIKLIDSLSEFLLVCVFREHRTQETEMVRERKINDVLKGGKKKNEVKVYSNRKRERESKVR